jgi:hypothetical protein
MERRRKAMWLYPKVVGFNPPERWGHSAVFFEGVVYVFGVCILPYPIPDEPFALAFPIPFFSASSVLVRVPLQVLRNRSF